MSIEELIELRESSEAPFQHMAYTVWLHNKILEKVQYELWQFREQKALNMTSTYAACNHIMSLPSLKTIK